MSQSREASLGAVLNGLHPFGGRGADAPPLALMPEERVPLLGMLRRYRAIITQPTTMAERCREKYVGPFTIRIPFFFDLTYLPGHAGMRFLSDLDPEIARMGPVMKRVPTVGYWFSRSDDGEAHLQSMLLAARKFMGARLSGERLAEVAPTVEAVMKAHTERWHGQQVDLADVMVTAIYEASLRCMLGDGLALRLAGDVIPLLRRIANGIDIPRTTRSTLPFNRWSPECRATRKLEKVLREVIAEHDASGRFPLIDDLRAIELDRGQLPEADVAWMLMYVMWNSVTYPGSYGLWSYLDIISRPELLERVVSRKGNRILELCFMETVRLNPVASLVRETTQPVSFEHEGHTYEIPAGGYIGTNTWALNRDAEVYHAPDEYRPQRYMLGEPLPHAFGRGAFGCVAGKYSKLLLASVHGYLVDHLDVELVGPLPERRSRVHLTYPDGRIEARVCARPVVLRRPVEPELSTGTSDGTSDGTSEVPGGCPFHHGAA